MVVWPRPALLAWVMTSKYLNHLPLYRLEQIAAREEVRLSRSTLAEWVGRVGVALQPLVDRLTWHLLQGSTLHADETPVAQLDPGNGKTRKAYLWAYRSNDLEAGPRIILFDYQAGCSRRHAQNFLQDWQSHLLVDDYGGYKPLFSSALPCTELGCWAHARRKFFELHQANNSSMAMEALQRIGMLYAIEAEGKHLTIEDRQQLRAEKSLPALNALHDWLLQTRSQTANGGGSAKALDYTLKRWPSLIRYAQSGHQPIGRVEMWRGGLRLGLSVSASFVWRCLMSLAITSSPHPARQTGRADFPHPAFFRPSGLRIQQVIASKRQPVESQDIVQVLVRVLAIPRSPLAVLTH
ncbi:transposase IS66 family protein [Nitrosomonas communis]|uniref:Transposase IS66 family protein n=1 Tax=Nitrosomonas communis TaxID=44574 RepID=A0A5D3Y8W9_9PROT|nr:transposase IS66 family protein [Nitrosomonas communis]